MFRQASNRYPRSKGFKVKHAFQIALLVAVSIWLLYQVKHSHDKKRAYDEKQATAKVESSDDGGSGWNSDILGRKGKVEISQDVGDNVDVVKNDGNAKEDEESVDRHDTLEENGNEDHGAGDDELDRHEDEKTEEEGQAEHEKIRENAMNNEEGKEAEEEEQNGDVGANFIQMKQETGGTEEATEVKDEHNEGGEEIPESKDKEHNIEQSFEDKNAENQTEIEHVLDHPIATGGEDAERNSTESVEVTKIVLEKNETADSSLGSEGENAKEKSSDSEGENAKETSSDTIKIDEVVPEQNETSSLDSSKDVPVVDPNTEKEGKKLEEKDQEANATLSDSFHDTNAEADSEKQEEKNKEVIIAEEHEIGVDEKATAKHESQADSFNGFHEPATSESKNGMELTGQTKSDNAGPVSSVDQGAAEGEVGVSHNALSEDVKGLISLDEDEAKSEHNSTVDHETTSETDNVSEGNVISTSSENNSTMESVHSDAGDAISQDMPEENEVGDHTDLGTLPGGEAEGQTTEELSVQ